MKTRPILFKGPMVRAILDGKKTQTRRLGKALIETTGVVRCRDTTKWMGWHNGRILSFYRCPYGIPGDHLWVRETWCTWVDIDAYALENEPIPVHYRADPLPDGYDDEAHFLDVTGAERWRPSIHMPRWASRLPLEITDVRAERVQDITPEDCEAEGISGMTKASPVRGQPYDEYQNGDGLIYTTPRNAFCALWDSIYAPPRPVKVGGVIQHYESYPWEVGFQQREHRGLPWLVYGNPWVWPITFKVVA